VHHLVSVRALSHTAAKIDADGADTIADIKAKIQETQGHPTATQKLIYAGMSSFHFYTSLIGPLQERCFPITRPSHHAR